MHAPHKRQLLEMALTRLSTLLDAELRVHALLRHDSYRAPVAPKAFKGDSCRAPRWTDPVMFAFVSDVPADRHLQATSRSVPREPFQAKFGTHTRQLWSGRSDRKNHVRLVPKGVFLPKFGSRQPCTPATPPCEVGRLTFRMATVPY